MTIIATEHDIEGLSQNPTFCHWLYNGLDCIVTKEVYDVLLPKLSADPDAMRCYSFERAVQAPAHCMMQRGVLIDEAARKLALIDLEKLELEQEAVLVALAAPYWDRTIQRPGKCLDNKPHRWTNSAVVRRQAAQANCCCEEDLHPIWHSSELARCTKCSASRAIPDGPNPRASDQIKHLLYDLLSLPPQYDHKTHKLTTGDEALQKLKVRYEEHYILIQAILDCRGVRKQISLLNSTPDPDGRWRASFNVGATEVDRWSSSKSPFRTGTNFQNIADRSRHIFVADPGLMIFYADLSQAESRIVAYDAEDLEYIKAHESSYDVHTFVAKQCWPELPWTGDPQEDKALAEQPTFFDPHHDYRLYAKKVQHGGNIGMSHVGIARELHIPQALAKQVITKLDTAFPRRKARQREIINEVTTTGAVRTFLARRRQFFERLWDSSTHREALAQTQQSSIGWLLNMALWRVWHDLDTTIDLHHAPNPSQPNRVWLLAQVHDAILGLVRQDDFETLREVRRLMSIPLPIRGRLCRIPVDIAYGPSWGHKDLTKLED